MIYVYTLFAKISVIEFLQVIYNAIFWQFLGDFTIDCDSSLGSEITLSGATIKSPNYPNMYDISKDCEITVRFVGRVRITFLAFDLEHDTTCSYDFLKIFDGPTSNSTQIGTTMCGNISPDPIESTQSFAHLVFKSDSTNARTGFRLRVEDPGNNSFLHDNGSRKNYILFSRIFS